MIQAFGLDETRSEVARPRAGRRRKGEVCLGGVWWGWQMELELCLASR